MQVDLGTDRVIEQVTLYPTTPAGFEHVKGFGFPIRFRIDASNDPDFRERQVIADLTHEDYPSPGDDFRSFNAKGVRGRYVRVTASKLWKREYGPAPYCFALAELEVRRAAPMSPCVAAVRRRTASNSTAGARTA